MEAQTKLDEMEIEDLTDFLSPDLEDADGDKWNDAILHDRTETQAL